MNERLPKRNSPLESQIVEILVERIRSGVYPTNSRIASESELAEEFGVSRSTVRGALATLAANGILKRRHGVGTFVSPATRIHNPLNEVINYSDLIIDHGYTFGYRHIGARYIPAKPEIAQALGIAPGDEILEVSKAFTADGELVICTVNLMPMCVFESAVNREDMLKPEATEPLYEFLEKTCGRTIDHYIATVRPSIAKEIRIHDQTLDVDPLLPVLVIEEVAYTASGDPVLHETEYLLGDRMKFDLVRRRRSSIR